MVVVKSENSLWQTQLAIENQASSHTLSAREITLW
jgi:hypothetical protein